MKITIEPAKKRTGATDARLKVEFDAPNSAYDYNMYFSSGAVLREFSDTLHQHLEFMASLGKSTSSTQYISSPPPGEALRVPNRAYIKEAATLDHVLRLQERIAKLEYPAEIKLPDYEKQNIFHRLRKLEKYLQQVIDKQANCDCAPDSPANNRMPGVHYTYELDVWYIDGDTVSDTALRNWLNLFCGNPPSTHNIILRRHIECWRAAKKTNPTK